MLDRNTPLYAIWKKLFEHFFSTLKRMLAKTILEMGDECNNSQQKKIPERHLKSTNLSNKGVKFKKVNFLQQYATFPILLTIQSWKFV